MSQTGFSPLHLAVRNQNIPQIREFLRTGADLNKQTEDEFRQTPLYMAVNIGNVEIVKILL